MNDELKQNDVSFNKIFDKEMLDILKIIWDIEHYTNPLNILYYDK